MGKKLARYVTVGGETYGPKDDVPDEVAKQIKNPKAWVPTGETPETDDYSGKEGGTSGGAKLAGPVTVGGVTYGPKDFIPDEVAKQIKNPKAWEGGKPPTGADKAADADGDKAGDGEGADPGVAAPDGTDTKTPRKPTSSAPKRS